MTAAQFNFVYILMAAISTSYLENIHLILEELETFTKINQALQQPCQVARN